MRALPTTPDSPVQPPPLPTRLQVSLPALRDNYRALSRLTGATVAAVVKADAYGLGLSPVATTLHAAGCRTFFTAFTSEAVSLREQFADIDIYVLSPLVAQDAAVLLAQRLRPCLYDLDGVDAWLAQTRAAGAGGPAALHLETGINRLGLSVAAARALAGDRRRRDALQLSLVMSHLASADRPDEPANAAQRARFEALRALFPGVPASLCNSGGVFLGPAYHFDLVRPGIALYGHDPHARLGRCRVQPVATFSGTLAQIKCLRAGESVGYGGDYTTGEDRLVGVVLGGYGDGLDRRLFDPRAGRLSEVAVDGRRVAVLGQVSMDMTVIDLSELGEPGVAAGDPVEFFGQVVPIEELARRAGTIPYEVLTRIGARTQRDYV